MHPLTLTGVRPSDLISAIQVLFSLVGLCTEVWVSGLRKPTEGQEVVRTRGKHEVAESGYRIGCTGCTMGPNGGVGLAAPTELEPGCSVCLGMVLSPKSSGVR